MLLRPRAPSSAVEGAARRLRQDVLHIILGIDQADRAVRLAVAIVPGIDHELAVSDLHPAVTLLVQDRLVDAATFSVAQHHVYSGCGDVSGLHKRGCSVRLRSLSLSAMLDRMVSLSSGICARTMASASSKVRRHGGSGKLSATSSHSVSAVSFGFSLERDAPEAWTPASFYYQGLSELIEALAKDVGQGLPDAG